MSVLHSFRYLLIFLVFLTSSCSSSPENSVSGEDTSYYIPERGTPAVITGLIKTDTIEISEMKFHPEELMITKGDTVIWINHDLVSHCVTEEFSKAWTSSPIPAGASWKMAVTEGAHYYCAIHVVMKGSIALESAQKQDAR